MNDHCFLCGKDGGEESCRRYFRQEERTYCGHKCAEQDEWGRNPYKQGERKRISWSHFHHLDALIGQFTDAAKTVGSIGKLIETAEQDGDVAKVEDLKITAEQLMYYNLDLLSRIEREVRRFSFNSLK